jgi:hypothetical protein
VSLIYLNEHRVILKFFWGDFPLERQKKGDEGGKRIGEGEITVGRIKGKRGL